MFRILGNAVSRHWHFLFLGWVLAVLGLMAEAPPWAEVVADGEFRFMPDDVPSRQGEDLFRAAFSRDTLGSNVVIVLRRVGSDVGLLDEDRRFIEDVLKPRIEEIAKAGGSLSDESRGGDDAPAAANGHGSIIKKVRTFNDSTIGSLLVSNDKKASLVFVELRTEFIEKANRDTIAQIEHLIHADGPLRSEGLIPPGLDLAISGSATVGRDMREAAAQSVKAIDAATLLLVFGLLVIIYRAPILALIPLATVYVAIKVSFAILGMLAEAGWIQVFSGVEIYATVVMYGAGVDFCMFLMARYKEELDAGLTLDEAIGEAVSRVGSALAASAGTTIAGIGMMMFAQFGKFQQAGFVMSFSLVFVLIAALTFAPALLLLFGRIAFWPNIPRERIAAPAGWLSPTSMIARLMERNWFSGVWNHIGQAVLKRPGTVWLACIATMMPLAILGVRNVDYVSYGLLSELPKNDPSVVGAEAVQDHFPAGITGPVTLLVHHPQLDFSTSAGVAAVGTLTERLYDLRDELHIAEVRSVAEPLGVAAGFESARKKSDAPLWAQRGFARKKAVEHYVADLPPYTNHVTRIDVIFQEDPFTRDSIARFERFRKTAREQLPDELKDDSRLLFTGSTASIRDLKAVTSGDQLRIDGLVVAAVYAVLVLLLWRPVLSAYLIASVLFSYFVTLGATVAVFWWLNPQGFAGLDWKVPMFLFTILIAVGEDYNIYLITRVEEEQQKHGPIKGIIVALTKTGSIISSCGLIMAGTFASLLAGSLVGIQQLGFALAFGVILDTFVIRSILVPAFLVMQHTGRFGRFGRFGSISSAEAEPKFEPPPPAHVAHARPTKLGQQRTLP